MEIKDLISNNKKENNELFSPIFNIFYVWKKYDDGKKEKEEKTYASNYSIVDQFLYFVNTLPSNFSIKQRLQEPLFIKELKKLYHIENENNDNSNEKSIFKYFVNEKGIKRDKINVKLFQEHIIFLENQEELKKWIVDFNDPYIKKKNEHHPCIYKEDCICKYMFGKENGFICISFNPNKNVYENNNDDNNFICKENIESNEKNTYSSHMCIIDQMYHTLATWWNMKQKKWNASEILMLQKIAIQPEENNFYNIKNIFFPFGNTHDGIIFPFPFIFPHDVLITGQFVKKIQLLI